MVPGMEGSNGEEKERCWYDGLWGETTNILRIFEGSMETQYSRNLLKYNHI